MGHSDQFVHLHVHTEYSMLDGAAKLPELFAETKRMGMPAIAMTDHGNVFGAYDFHRQATEAGIKPIIGMEGYYTPGSRFDRQPFDFGDSMIDEPGDGGSNRGKSAFCHMTMLATSTLGMHNLFRISSLASLEGQYRKPRFDRDLLERYGEGLIATTGCPSGEVNMWLRAGKYDKALAAAADFRDIFGRDNFYVELMEHGLEIERATRRDLLRIAQELALPLLATNDLHYTHQHEAGSHDALLCIQTGAKLSETKRLRFNGDGYYLKSPSEMRALFAEYPQACDNTLVVAEKCSAVQFTEGADLMPRFDVPDGESQESWLVKEVEAGLHRRYPNGITDQARARADYELGVICEMGFPAYFLVVADFIRFAREGGIRVGPGRGSAAGSIVAYALWITDLDPLVHGLLFERFLNPERVSMPDIDIDFDERRRGEVIRYVSDKYGEDRVAQIVTYGTIKAKAAIKDACRVMDKPFAVGEQLTKLMPAPVMGKDMSLAAVFDPADPRYREAADFRKRCEEDADAKEIVDQARGLEGLKRQWGVHAAGVLIGSQPLIDLIPIMRREADGAVITQFDYPTCETLGLLKMDFLGLRNLTILDDAVNAISADDGPTLDLSTLDLTDTATYELLSAGDTLGVFQLDGGPMRALLRSLRPDSFVDIAAVLALYRPGPMGANAHNDYADRKNQRQVVGGIHPELEAPLAEILGETYGLIVFQEQVLAIAQQISGFTLGEADLLRRAMGKKKKAELDAQKDKFFSGGTANGYSEAAIKALWDILLPFSDYAFNKSHTAAYGLVSYWTAYLKANYPAAYMAALLTSMRDDKDRMAVYLGECRRMGITVLPPDVNSSAADFAPVDGDIRFGLGAIRNVGRNVVACIERARAESGVFTDFFDFLRKVDAAVCNKKVLESLIKGGAFDSLGHSRQGLLTVHAQAVDMVLDVKRAEAIGQFDLFADTLDENGSNAAMMDLPVPGADWDKRERLAFERDMLGLYVSDHPLLGLEHVLSAHAEDKIADIQTGQVEDGSFVTIAGLLSGLTLRTTRAGAPMASASLEDMGGAIDVMIFPQTYAKVSLDLANDAILTVRGRVDRREESPKIIVQEIGVPDITQAARGPVMVSLAAARCTPPVVARLREVLGTHPGTTEVRLRLLNGGRETVLRLDHGLRVSPTASLMGEIKALLGPASVALM
ncbi:MAG: DNA polymerase III subunit alpha [Geodermatophilaceae bacterium]|nr:DNA polymerase III subunit alpha [Geodermatophilaceae bacterium]